MTDHMDLSDPEIVEKDDPNVKSSKIAGVTFKTEAGVRHLSAGERLITDSGVLVGKIACIVRVQSNYAGFRHGVLIDYSVGGYNEADSTKLWPLGIIAGLIGDGELTTLR